MTEKAENDKDHDTRLVVMESQIMIVGKAFNVFAADGNYIKNTPPWRWHDFLCGLASLFFNGDEKEAKMDWLYDCDDPKKLAAVVLKSLDDTGVPFSA